MSAAEHTDRSARQRLAGAASWAPTRQRFAAIGVQAAAFTAAAVALAGDAGWHAFAASAYVLVAVIAIVSPGWIAAQVVGGQALVGSLLLQDQRPGLLPLMLLIAGVIVTAELLALASSMQTPIRREPRDDIRRAARNTAVAASAFGAVMAVVGLPGPRGLIAIVIASAACALLAGLLLRRDETQPAEDSSVGATLSA